MDAGLFSAVSGFKFTSRKHRISDDDAVDRINSYYVPVIIVIMSSVLMAKMYVVGDPIQCWIPQEFSEAWEQYAESYCWVKNTYFLPMNQSVQSDRSGTEKQELKYYQWVPFVLALQALMFYLPSFVWKIMNWQSSVQLKTLVGLAVDCLADDKDARQNKVALVASHIEASISTRSQRSQNNVMSVIKNRGSGGLLIAAYLFVKLLYIVNCVGQFFLLNKFLDTKYNLYGIRVLIDLWRNHDWQHSGHFPRITLCDFNIRSNGDIKPYTLTCVLVVNLLNEKIFIFLWFLLLAVTVLTIVDAVDWFVWALLPGKKFNRLRRYVRPKHSAEFDEFTRTHVKSGDAFVLRMLSKNSGDPIVRDVVTALWKRYFETKDARERTEEKSDDTDDSYKGVAV